MPTISFSNLAQLDQPVSEYAPVIARVNGVALHGPDDMPDPAELRQRACTELLRQAARRDGLLPAGDAAPLDGIVSEAASDAIERWLDTHLQLPAPSDEACRRYHAAHARRYRRGERVHMRHVLFAVTPGVDVGALRARAERCLLDVRCHDSNDHGSHSNHAAFEAAARDLSNCPSSVNGGDLGWVTSEDCAPELARELFGQVEIGVLPRLVHSRFGLHVVEILARDAGAALPYDAVKGAVQHALQQQTWMTALRQCLQLLAADAELEGVTLDEAASPLVQ